MINKRNLKSLVVMAASLIMWMSVTSAVCIKMDLSWLISSNSTPSDFKTKISKIKLSHVHFGDNWNDFWWVFYFSSFNDENVKNVCSQVYWEWSLDTGDDQEEVNGKGVIWKAMDNGIEIDCYCKKWYENQSREVVWEDGELETYSYCVPGSKEKNEVVSGDSTYECSQMVKWVYYNAERWERLWPLDSKTLRAFGMDKDWLTMEWGFYTSCRNKGYSDEIQKCVEKTDEKEETYLECINRVNEKYSATYGIYGYIEHEYKWMKTALVAWVDYEITNASPWIWVKKNSNLSETFQRLDNLKPLWFIYDTNGGLWFVGCKAKENWLKTVVKAFNDEKGKEESAQIVGLFVDDPNTGRIYYQNDEDGKVLECNDLWSAEDSLLNFVVEWLMKIQDTQWSTMNNMTDKKIQNFASYNITNGSVINDVQKKAEELCRWKWITNINNVKNSNDKIICFNPTNRIPINAQAENLKNKTIIAKNANVEVVPSKDIIYDIFVDGWYLVINDSNVNNYLFNNQWFIIDNGKKYTTSVDMKDYINEEWASIKDFGWIWVNLKGTFIVNGLIRWKNPFDSLQDKYFVHGKLISLNSYEELENNSLLKYVQSVLGDKSVMWTDVSIPKKFTRSCNAWISRNIPCPVSAGTPNPYLNAALSVIDQDYNSVLLKN